MEKNININFIRKVNKVMKITIKDMGPEYDFIKEGSTYNNGINFFVWDTRFEKIQKISHKCNLNCIAMDRKIWKAPLVLDEEKETLFVFTSTNNLNEVIRKVEKGNNTHYLYLLTCDCTSEDEQLSIFDEDNEEKIRKENAHKILGNLLKNVKNVLVVHYEYVAGEAVNGTISQLDNSVHIISSQSIDELLGDGIEELEETIVAQKVVENEKPAISWNPKKTDQKENG